MRIAEIAPPWFTVPPQAYGGVELIVAVLADGLVGQGHDVTLFASGGSTTKAELVSAFDAPPDASMLGNVWFDTYHAASAYLSLADFDLVHDHSGIVGPALGAVRGHPPVVHTLHGPWTEPARRYYSLLQHHVHLVAISEAQRRDFPDLRYAGMVYNGLDLTAYPYCADKHDYLLYVGRANPDKGPGRAIEIARRAGMPLAMVVKKNEPFELAYWDEIVAPMLTDDVEVFESVTPEAKSELLGRARALVFPIEWPEPFGLVMIEAMACGTPVVTCPVGAAPELVVDGVTGYLRETIDDLAEALQHVDECAPATCRSRVEAEFSGEVMVSRYQDVFTRVLTPTP